jgi:hypothetical protein
VRDCSKRHVLCVSHDVELRRVGHRTKSTPVGGCYDFIVTSFVFLCLPLWLTRHSSHLTHRHSRALPTTPEHPSRPPNTTPCIYIRSRPSSQHTPSSSPETPDTPLYPCDPCAPSYHFTPFSLTLRCTHTPRYFTFTVVPPCLVIHCLFRPCLGIPRLPSNLHLPWLPSGLCKHSMDRLMFTSWR